MSDRWADDPELVATFRAEVTDRLAAMGTGLLGLVGHPAPRQAVAPLLRDAHTVKGSARMLGLDDVLALMHRVEDVLLAVADRRLGATPALVDLLLRTCDTLGRALPGSHRPVPSHEVARLLTDLQGALDGGGGGAAVPAPRRAPRAAEPEQEAPEQVAPQPVTPPRAHTPAAADPVRVPAERIYALLDVVGEAGLGARRVAAEVGTLTGQVADSGRWAGAVRDSLARAGVPLPPDADLALDRLAGSAEAVRRTAEGLGELLETGEARLVQVRDAGMGLAMVPLHRVVAAFPRLVRDVAAAGGKDVRLELHGEDTELDKKILDGVADALRHLVTNAVDHGCEPAAGRLAAGKPAQAVVTVSARTAGSRVVVTVADDGSGVDPVRVRDAAVAAGLLAPGAAATAETVLPLLFAPALSTSRRVTAHSGRGVGLDVVQRAVQGLGGTVEVASSLGRGTTFTLTVPVTLGVVRCLVARVGAERYALPVAAVVESLSLRGTTRHQVAGAVLMVREGVSTPLRDLGDALGTPGPRTPAAAVLVDGPDGRTAWAVDRLEGEREVVVTALGEFLGRLPGVAGATLDDDGSVLPLLDLRELASVPCGVPAVPAAVEAERPRRVLVAEDSVGVRELERVLLEKAGYLVETAVDGADALARAQAMPEPADLLLSDVEMPGLDGFALVRAVRALPGWGEVAVVMMTSRGDEAARREGLAVGADAYLLKGDFAADDLVGTVRRLVG